MILSLIKISSIITAFFSFGLCCYVLAINPKSKINITWSLACFAIGLWSCSHFVLMQTRSDNIAQLFLYPLYLGTIFIPIFYFQLIKKQTVY